MLEGSSGGSQAGAGSPRPWWIVAASEEGEEMAFGFPGPRCRAWSGFWTALTSACVTKAKHCRLCAVPCVSVCLLHLAAEDKLCLCTSLLVERGRSELWGWPRRPCVASFCGAACPGARLWNGQSSQGLALSFLCLWFQRNFLQPFLSGAFGNCWAKLGYTHLPVLDRSCQDLPALEAGMLYPGSSGLSQKSASVRLC